MMHPITTDIFLVSSETALEVRMPDWKVEITFATPNWDSV